MRLSGIGCLMALGIVLALPGQALADRSEQHGDIVLHYNAMPTTRLPAEVAQRYNIPRSRVQAMVLVSVLDKGEPIAATIRGHALTQDDEQRELRFRRLDTGGQVSHVSLVSFDAPETLRFELDVRPRGQDDTFTVRFRETFHDD